MAIKAAIILVSLLSLYGADVAVLHLSDDKVGFLPFDHMIRGIGLGMPALILPFISFIIARKNVSKILGVLLIISAILIIAGGIVILGEYGCSKIVPCQNDADASKHKIQQTYKT